MELAQLITAAPNLAFGFACLWYAFQVQKERMAAQERYAASLEAINRLYMELLEKAIHAIALNTSQSADNGESMGRLHAEFAAIRNDIRSIRDLLTKFARDSGKRSPANSG